MKKCPTCRKPINKCTCSLPNLGEYDEEFTVVEVNDPISPIDYPESNMDDGSESYDDLEFECSNPRCKKHGKMKKYMHHMDQEDEDCNEAFSVVESDDFDINYPDSDLTTDDDAYDDLMFEDNIIDYPADDEDFKVLDIDFEDYQYNNDGLDSPHYDDSNLIDDEEELIVEVDDSEDEECPICGCNPCECESLTEELGDNQQSVDKVKSALSTIVDTIDSAEDGFFDGVFGSDKVRDTFQGMLDTLSKK